MRFPHGNDLETRHETEITHNYGYNDSLIFLQLRHRWDTIFVPAMFMLILHVSLT